MKQMKLYSIGNRGKFNYYIFEKSNKSVKCVLGIVYNIFKSWFELYKEYEDKNGVWRKRRINFENTKDKHMFNVSKNESIDLFLGEKKIFVTINCTASKRKRFNEELFKKFKMPKEKKLKEATIVK